MLLASAPEGMACAWSGAGPLDGPTTPPPPVALPTPEPQDGPDAGLAGPLPQGAEASDENAARVKALGEPDAQLPAIVLPKEPDAEPPASTPPQPPN